MKMRLLTLFLLCAALQLPAQTIVQQFFAIGSMPSPTADMDLPTPTTQGNVLIAMPGPTSNGVKVLSVTDNAPAGSNTYKQVPGAASSCGKTKTIDIWYCENCSGGVTELKFRGWPCAKDPRNRLCCCPLYFHQSDSNRRGPRLVDV